MGSWSVACGISHIAITSGHDCVIIPLKKNMGYDEGRIWQAATLPIFGKYNDYGGMEEIIEDDNTKLIEEHFGVTIDEFVTFLVDGKFTYGREEAEEVAEKMKNLKEAENWQFMWIDRKVYDFMIVDNDKWYRGHNDYGTPEMLKLFGFKQVKDAKIKNYDSKRFNQLWQRGDVKFYSDGDTLLTFTGDRYVYHYGHGDESSLETYFDVPKEFEYIKNLNQVDTWRLMSRNDRYKHLGSVLGKRDMNLYDIFGDDFVYRVERMKELMVANPNMNTNEIKDILDKESPSKKIEKPLYKQYYDEFEKFGDRICQLWHVYHNLYPMSGMLQPHILYLTPQCGEFAKHQKMLDKFAEINRVYAAKQGDDEEEA